MLLYLKKGWIGKMMESIASRNFERRVAKVEAKIAELKERGKDTAEIEEELYFIKKDLEMGLREVAKIRLDALEKKIEGELSQ